MRCQRNTEEERKMEERRRHTREKRALFGLMILEPIFTIPAMAQNASAGYQIGEASLRPGGSAQAGWTDPERLQSAVSVVKGTRHSPHPLSQSLAECSPWFVASCTLLILYSSFPLDFLALTTYMHLITLPLDFQITNLALLCFLAAVLLIFQDPQGQDCHCGTQEQHLHRRHPRSSGPISESAPQLHQNHR